MTPAQRRLYLGMIRLFNHFPSGSAWTGVQGSSTGLGEPTYAALPSRTIRWLENNRVAERMSLPDLPIYTAPWWGLAAIDVDIQPGDIYTNGTRSFLVTGASDTSCGFQVIPAKVWTGALPGVVVTQAGYRSPLWILGIGA